MPVSAFAARLAAAAALLASLGLLAAACAGGDGPKFKEITAVIASSELAVGENRFVVGLLDENAEEIPDAEVTFAFFKLDGDTQTPKGEAKAKALTVKKSYTHTHEDGTVETHGAGQTGVYVAYPTFDEAGSWGVQISGTAEGKEFDPVGTAFTVLEKAKSVAVGAPAPRSDTLTLDDVADITEIDTSDPPIPEQHTMSIAEAVTSGKPSVIVFATPAFCLSRICGPTKETADELFREYKDRAVFVHVEPYDLEKARAGDGLFPVKAAAEWGLQSEPWVFLVNGEGIVAAKFEGVVTLEELKAALEPLLAA